MALSDQERAISKVLHAIECVKNGGMVIMVDDEDRENEGDLVFPAEHTTPEKINFMVKEARGLVCLTLEPEITDRLNLPMMADSTKNEPDQETAFTVSIEAKHGVTTGISAEDRSHTINVAINDNATPKDIVVPGHIFPLKARKGGTLRRAGHTEGSVDLAKLAGLKGAGVICEIMNDDGTMARMPDLETFSKKHNIPIVAIADIITYRLMRESLVEEVGREKIRTHYGVFESVLFRNVVDGTEHVAITNSSDFSDDIVDVRVHLQNSLVDVLGNPECGGGYKMHYGLKLLADSKKAVLVYLANSGSEFSIEEQLKMLSVDSGSKPVVSPLSGDDRTLGTGAQIVKALGVERMRVHTSTPEVIKGLSGYGLSVVETQQMQIPNKVFY